MAILITGGPGFIGSNLVCSLLSQGEEIHLLCRARNILKDHNSGALKVFYGDITNKDSITPAIRGCKYVFHLAGYTRNWARDPSLFSHIHIGGFLNIAELAFVHNVERMILTSSVVTLGPTNTDIGNENMFRQAEMFFTDYERTKYLAEVQADRLVKSGLPLVTVLPTRVYGPGKMTEGNSVTIMMRKYLKGKFPFILNKGDEVGNYVYVDDVVDGHIKAISRGKIGQKYILGGDNCSLNQFFSTLREISGKRPPQFHVPPTLAKWFGTAEEIRARVTGSYPFISRGWIETFLRNWAYSSSKAITELGYHYRGIREGIELTHDWLLAEKLV